MQQDVSQDHGGPSARSRESCLRVSSRASHNNPHMPHAHMSDTSMTKRRVTLSKCLARSVGSELKTDNRAAYRMLHGHQPHEAGR